MNKKERQLKTLIQLAKADEPGKAFTDMVMKEVLTGHQQEAALRSVLSPLTPDPLPVQFTLAVMQKIENRHENKMYPPIISSKTWYLVAAIVLGLGVFIFRLNQRALPHPNYVRHTTSRLYDNFFYQLKPEYTIILVATSILLIIDYLFSRSQQQKKLLPPAR
jgi:hypothetical protein